MTVLGKCAVAPSALVQSAELDKIRDMFFPVHSTAGPVSNPDQAGADASSVQAEFDSCCAD
jgi:hypothetical protein